MDVAFSHPIINKFARWNGLDDKKFRRYISKVGGQEYKFNLCRATDHIIKLGKFAYFLIFIAKATFTYIALYILYLMFYSVP